MFSPITLTTVDTPEHKQIVTAQRLNSNLNSYVKIECIRRNIRYRTNGSVLTDDPTIWIMEVNDDFHVPVVYSNLSPATKAVQETYTEDVEQTNENGQIIIVTETRTRTVDKLLYISEYTMFHYLFVENPAPISIRQVIINAIKRHHDLETSGNMFVLPLPAGTPVPAPLMAMFFTK